MLSSGGSYGFRPGSVLRTMNSGLLLNFFNNILGTAVVSIFQCYLKIQESNKYNELYCGMKINFSICCNVLQHYMIIIHYYVNP